jgi:hypothetical protein
MPPGACNALARDPGPAAAALTSIGFVKMPLFAAGFGVRLGSAVVLPDMGGSYGLLLDAACAVLEDVGDGANH